MICIVRLFARRRHVIVIRRRGCRCCVGWWCGWGWVVCRRSGRSIGRRGRIVYSRNGWVLPSQVVQHWVDNLLFFFPNRNRCRFLGGWSVDTTCMWSAVNYHVLPIDYVMLPSGSRNWLRSIELLLLTRCVSAWFCPICLPPLGNGTAAVLIFGTLIPPLGCGWWGGCWWWWWCAAVDGTGLVVTRADTDESGVGVGFLETTFWPSIPSNERLLCILLNGVCGGIIETGFKGRCPVDELRLWRDFFVAGVDGINDRFRDPLWESMVVLLLKGWFWWCWWCEWFELDDGGIGDPARRRYRC